MIVVIEGPSAVGKTTLLQRMPPEQVVGEDWDALGFPRSMWPDLQTPEGQQFGLMLMSHRWELLLGAEAQFGQAYGDTDPLKLYYDFALAALGVVSPAELADEFRRTRQAIAEHCVGFADHVVFLWATPAVLQQRKEHDASRRRGKFDLHVRLIDFFAAYYNALERLRPGTVHRLDAAGDVDGQAGSLLHSLAPHAHDRYDVALFDQLQQELIRLLL